MSRRCSRPQRIVSGPSFGLRLHLIEIAFADADELVPEDGKDEIYDNVMSEINDLEDELNRELKKIRKETGYDLRSCVIRVWR